MKNKIYKNKNKGAAMMILVFFFVFLSLTIIIGIVTPVVREFQVAGDSFNSKQTYFLAESSVEDVMYRINNSKQVGTSESLVLGSATATTTITDLGSDKKEISSLADTSSHQRKVNLILSIGVGASFSYGMQSGVGGIDMSNNSSIVGSIYSNGPITGSGSITGSATSANSAALFADQSNGSGTPSTNISFGNANSTQDMAQSFQVSIDEVVNKSSLYLKKVGSPSNLTVRIVSDSSGSPGTSTITSGTLSASLVSTNYGWVSVSFTTNPGLTAGTTYWLVIDGSTSSSNYYVLGASSASYANGVGKIGQYSGTWSSTTPSDLDTFFQIYLGGLTGSISGISVGGSAYAHTVTGATITGTNYCQVGSNNNKSCDTSRTDPVQVDMPISDQNILDWKDDALVGGTYSGNYTVSSNVTLGPKKITGNLLIDNNKILTMSGTIWVVGNLTVSNGGELKLSSTYGANSGVIVVDGTISINNNAKFFGSGNSSSYILAVTTSSSTSAITVGNNAGAVILHAPDGTVTVSNGAGAKEINGKQISLDNNATISYESGLANLNFTSGPTGSWTVSSWKEIQ